MSNIYLCETHNMAGVHSPSPYCTLCDLREKARVHAENEQLRAMLRWAASGTPMTDEIRRSIREALSESVEQKP